MPWWESRIDLGVCPYRNFCVVRTIGRFGSSFQGRVHHGANCSSYGPGIASRGVFNSICVDVEMVEWQRIQAEILKSDRGSILGVQAKNNRKHFRMVRPISGLLDLKNSGNILRRLRVPNSSVAAGLGSEGRRGHRAPVGEIYRRRYVQRCETTVSSRLHPFLSG